MKKWFLFTTLVFLVINFFTRADIVLADFNDLNCIEKSAGGCARGYARCDVPNDEFCCQPKTDCAGIVNFPETCIFKSAGGCSRGYAQCSAPNDIFCCSGGACSQIQFGQPGPTITPRPAGPGQTIPVYDPTCASGGPYGINYGGVKTALGCLPTDPQAFINTATPWAVGIGAGIAFLLGVFGAIMIVLSAGNPEKMQAGKEMITSAIGGIILIVFSVFILRVIGVDILKLF